MKWGKKLIAMLMALVCIMPCAAMPTYAVLPEEVSVTDSSIYQFLRAMEIVKENETFTYVSSVSRGQFLSYAVRLYGHETYLSGYDNPFKDLPKNHEYYDDIITAYYIGLVGGSDGEIRPDDDITWQEAAKILLGLLGYGAVCEANGGYPNGYTVQAGQLRLFPRNVTSEKYITPSELLEVLVNTLETDICRVTITQITNGNAEYEFEITKRETLLKAVHEIYEGVGVVDANQFTTLYSGNGCGQGKVRIDGVIYSTTQFDAEELLGHRVDYYYKTDGDDRILIYATPASTDTAITFAADDISSELTTMRELVYYDEETGDKRSRDIAVNASLILNGAQMPMQKSLLCPQSGYVTLVDRDDDGEADVVLVTSYRTIRVSSVSRFDYMVIDALGGDAIVVDPKDSSYVLSIVKDGKPADFESIEKNDIISYAVSSNGKINYKQLVISSETVSGTVTETDEKKITIDGNDYRVASNLAQEDLLNKTGTFYLNYLGWIVDWDGGQDVAYGFLNIVGWTSGINHTLQAQIYTENDRWVELDFANHVNYNGKMTNCKDITFPEDYRQLITYTVNSEGKINLLNFATVVKTSEQWTDEEQKLIRNHVFRLSRSMESTRYRSSNTSFDGAVALSSETKVFCVPTDGSTDKDDFYMRAATGLSADTLYKNVKCYDVDEVGVCQVCVMDSTSMKGAISTGDLTVCAGVGSTVTDDGDCVPSLMVWMDGEKLSMPVQTASVISQVGGIRAGDIVKYSVDNKGRVVKITKYFDSSLGLEQKFVTNDLYNKTTFAAGYIRACGENRIRFDAGTQFTCTTTGLGTVYIYDTEDKRITKGSAEDLREGIYGFGYISYLKLITFIIFK